MAFKRKVHADSGENASQQNRPGFFIMIIVEESSQKFLLQTKLLSPNPPL